MTTGPAPPPTTPPTVAHDSTGSGAQWCNTCQGYTHAPWCWAYVDRDVLDHVEQSAAAIRARRAALLERADVHSPTEGAIALAEAHLADEAWYRHLPNNAMQDAAVLELAGEIESAVGSWLQRRQEES